jgi:hypothetical protein
MSHTICCLFRGLKSVKSRRLGGQEGFQLGRRRFETVKLFAPYKLFK